MGVDEDPSTTKFGLRISEGGKVRITGRVSAVLIAGVLSLLGWGAVNTMGGDAAQLEQLQRNLTVCETQLAITRKEGVTP